MSSPALPKGVDFRPMTRQDIGLVLDIIKAHDEDDFEEAQETYKHSLEGQYVLTVDNRVVGTTGAEEDEETDSTWWLSWTYLDEQRQGSGLGAVMLVKMIDLLREWKARKVFVSTSDYVDLGRGQIYRDAMAAYQRLGFEQEVKNLNFYDRNESRVVMGLRLAPERKLDRLPPPDTRGIEVFGIADIPETEDACMIEWEFTDDEGVTAQEIEDLIEDAGRQQARVLFTSCGSDAAEAINVFRSAGFMEEGRLVDFYEDGVDDVHLRYDIM